MLERGSSLAFLRKNHTLNFNEIFQLFMCINNHLIYTKQGKPLVVPCGHCEACRQAKANRMTSLIRSESIGDGIHETLFVTLTYDNKHLPFIKKSEIIDNMVFDDPDKKLPQVVNVYRHSDVRFVRVGFGNYSPVRKHCGYIGKILFPNLSYNGVVSLKGYRQKRFSSRCSYYEENSDKVGILYFPDIQNFFKRLRLNYERIYHQRLEMSYFYTGEIGPDTLRPHFHALIRIKKEDESSVRHAIVKSWQFHDWLQLERKCPGKQIQIAIDCAKYVSSYVNSSSYLPSAFQGSQAVPKCCHSHFYGFSRNAFTLSSLLEAFNRRDLHYNLSFDVGGCRYVYKFLYPSYVIKRWFPKFKGFSKLPFDVIYRIYKNPYTLLQYARQLGYDSHYNNETFTDYFRRVKIGSIDLTPNFRFDVGNFSKHNDLILNLNVLLKARQRFLVDHAICYDGDITGSIYDKYAFVGSQIWTIYASNSLKDSYDNIPSEDWTLFSFKTGVADNVNTSNTNLFLHYNLLDRFNKLDKSKKLNHKLQSSIMLNF